MCILVVVSCNILYTLYDLICRQKLYCLGLVSYICTCVNPFLFNTNVSSLLELVGSASLAGFFRDGGYWN